jgi:hypothetical protein
VEFRDGVVDGEALEFLVVIYLLEESSPSFR